jgi:hypothetical protein
MFRQTMAWLARHLRGRHVLLPEEMTARLRAENRARVLVARHGRISADFNGGGLKARRGGAVSGAAVHLDADRAREGTGGGEERAGEMNRASGVKTPGPGSIFVMPEGMTHKLMPSQVAE